MNFQKSHIQVTVFVTLLLLLRSMCSFLYLFGSVCASFCFLTSWYRTDAACLLAGCNTFTKHQRRLEQKTDRAIGAQNLILAKMFPRLDQCQTIRRACFWGQWSKNLLALFAFKMFHSRPSTVYFRPFNSFVTVLEWSIEIANTWIWTPVWSRARNHCAHTTSQFWL